MMADDQWDTVGHYVSLQRGTTYSGKLVGAPGPALLGLGSIEPGGGFRADHYKTFGGECPAKLMLAPGDIYVALKGATKDGSMVGSVARLPESVPAGRLTQDTARLDFVQRDEEVVSHLYWVLRTPQYRQYCAGRLTGSAAASFSRSDFLSYPVPPVTSTSRTIVRLLDATERKVELKRRMNETLETMARALFKSWFVDFDPVRAKGQGKKLHGMDEETAALFPDSFDDSELGEIPAGWHVEPLSRTGRFLNGLACQRFPPENGRGLPVLKIAELRKGNTMGADRASATIPAEYRVQDGDLIFSWSGSLDVKFWYGGPAALNQHLFKVTSDRFPLWLCYEWILNHIQDFQHIAAGKATTMGHIQRHHLDEAFVAVPPGDLILVIDRLVSTLFARIKLGEIESRSIASLRDALLAKLLSGEIRVDALSRCSIAPGLP